MKKPRQQDDIEGTKRLMGALGRMKPKPHEEMKVGKRQQKKTKAGAKRPTTKGEKQSK